MKLDFQTKQNRADFLFDLAYDVQRSDSLEPHRSDADRRKVIAIQKRLSALERADRAKVDEVVSIWREARDVPRPLNENFERTLASSRRISDVLLDRVPLSARAIAKAQPRFRKAPRKWAEYVFGLAVMAAVFYLAFRWLQLAAQ